ncbi:PilN domain-containing protein [Paralysiella testudinis]|uniref:PilN domain-containing protein n=2 Tax=Paralysiella testudinis TaxID=2809020 RepID=A0A892ZHX0_9NEIS|nr:PilN domain-containing protein [Paralysiella testudinis]
MIPMIKINLLPYREALLQQQKQKFKTLMLLGLLLALALAALSYFAFSGAVASQQGRNQALKDGLEQLDAQIKEINNLKAEKAGFLARKQKVEELENKRFEAARIIDTLNTLVPEGLYLTAITGDDANPNNYSISGKAISDSKIAMFMRAIPSTGLFNSAELDNIKKVNDAQEFIVKVSINRPEPVAAEASAASAP